MSFERNVFINCPFDNEYRELLHSLIFAILYFDFEPKISQTQSSSNIRINQIKLYIKESKYGIHDLSRSKPMKRNEVPRFNMPYELGLDMGCCEYGGRKFREKRILVLETERYYYQKVISDIAGQDIESHDDDPSMLIMKVRNWFSAVDDTRTYPSASTIWKDYQDFYNDTSINLSGEGFTTAEIDNMPNSDFIKFAKEWLKKLKL